MFKFLSQIRRAVQSQNQQTRSRVSRNRKSRFEIENLEPRIVLSAITGTIYDDVDSSGTKTGGDNTLGGWQVYVDMDNSGTLNNRADGTLEPSAFANSGGDYTINMNGLPTGTYRVAEIAQPGWTPTAPISRDVAFNSGQDSNKIDFFNFAGGGIVGTVWNDLNADGIRAVEPLTGEFTDPGLEGWTVFIDMKPAGGGGLNGIPDSGEPITTTDASGQYHFSNLPAGDYEVTEVQPTGWDIPPGKWDTKQTVTVKALTTATQDYANSSLVNGSINGSVWNDVNIDGLRDTDPITGDFTEPGLAGWTIFLDTSNDGILDPTETSTVTDANGNYSFISLAAGNYEVTEVMPAGWDVSPLYDSRQTVAVAGGLNSTANDFANFTVQNGSISGTVWNDLFRDGVRNRDISGAYTDPGIAGWTVYLDMNRNGAFDSTEATAITDANGQYVFPSLQVGEYDVIEIVPTGWETAPRFGDNYSVRIYSGAESVAHDFANFNLSTLIPGTVSGTVWNDVNANGVIDSTPTAEPGLGGRVVFADVNSNGILDDSEPRATTKADGTYTISGVSPGTVSIVDVLPAGWRATSPVTSVRSLALKNGENATGINYGNAELKNSTISGAVFADTNKNGVRDAGEHGLAGITVYLDLNNSGTLDAGDIQTTTSADLYYTPSINEAGNYNFDHLASGTYSVRQIISVELSATPSTQFEHSVTMVAAENHSGVDFADVFRLNEIHGVKFDDANGNHVRDADEKTVAGTTIFIDSNRNNVLDADETSTITGSDGSYSFTGLTPGAYVVREVVESGYGLTFPTTSGGILWPTGVTNPGVGNVSPTSITTSLMVGQSYTQTVSLTLPNTGALTNAVDVFLLFDDTGSFTNNSPIVRAAFPNIITQLQTSLSGTDLAFGVGRFEEYGNFASEYGTGRPFVLNQPIVAASTPGYMTTIQAALNRTTPGYGGDGPETDIEALYQLVTGIGFDGNNNGSVMDSGVAGLGSTQLLPGNSGDVPSFASFTADASAGVLPAAGTVGGAGFRAGALPVILLATDIGFAYQPKGETSIIGANGLTLPVSDLTGTSRASTPFNSGAGLQETITGLNALGALVIGLGTNTQSNVDPRQGLEAISKLTGAINRSTGSIDNGTGTPIAPGDPLYFQISSGFAGSVAAGVQNAIQNAVTNVAMNITVQASDPRVHIINHTGTRTGIGSGQTASFDIEFIGDGIPHRFDLQFVREGTNVVLGSIPVVLGTPIPGDGYHFDDLEEGELEFEDHFGDYASGSVASNVAPGFVAGSDQVAPEDAGTQTVTSWATSISPGPASEASQAVNFVVVSNDNASLFSVQPTISADGILTFTSAPDAFGTATLSVVLRDNGGTANGGVDTSAPQTFTINITAVNDAPVAQASSVTADEDVALTFSATDFLFSDAEGDSLASILLSGLNLASGDSLTVDLGAGPVAVSNGITIPSAAIPSLTFTPAHVASGAARSAFDFIVNDADSGTVSATMTINVASVNDAPTFNQASYSFVINSKALLGSTVGLSTATDPDAGNGLTYTIVDGNAPGAFAINPATGQITIANAAKLPKIVAPATTVVAPVLTVQVSDGSLIDTATVTVTLNLAPQAMAPIAAARATSFNLKENNAVAATAASLAGSPAYTGQLLANWSVSDTPGGPASTNFYIRSSTTTGAVIGASSKLSFEDQSSFTIYVTVSDSLDSTKTVTTPVTINIIDVNDAPHLSLTDGVAGPPTFTSGTPVLLVSKYTINEYTKVTAGSTPKNGDVLFTLNASDDDQSSSSLLYALTGTGVTSPGPGVFVDKTGAVQFDAATGQITVIDATKLDFEKFRAGIPLAFSVTDNGVPGSLPGATPKALISKATVTILLNDINDAPTFKTPTLSVVKAENNRANAAVFALSATDGDTLDGVTQPLTYSLVSVLNADGVDVTGMFTITSVTNATTGAVTFLVNVIPAKLYDFESTANRTFTFIVRATEDGVGGLSTADSVFGDQVVTLNITDVNEAPSAVFSPISGSPSVGTTGSVTVSVGSVSVGTTIGALSITDPDIFVALGNYGPDSVVVTVLDGSSTTAPALTYVANANPTTGGSLRINNLTTLQSRVGKPFTVRFTIKDKDGLTGALSFTLTLTINVIEF